MVVELELTLVAEEVLFLVVAASKLQLDEVLRRLEGEAVMMSHASTKKLRMEVNGAGSHTLANGAGSLDADGLCSEQRSGIVLENGEAEG